MPELLEALHPTPAVCGSPKDEAMNLIRKLEEKDREYYCGIVGPARIRGSTNLFVNLRCMRVFEDKIRLHAGGGITKDSDPEAEWMETENKCQTMLDLLS